MMKVLLQRLRFIMTASSKWERAVRRTVAFVAGSVSLLVFCGLAITLAKAQQPYCAFEVRVDAPSGKPAPGVPVALLRTDKTTYSNATTGSDGIARMCDSPLQTVHLVVG